VNLELGMPAVCRDGDEVGTLDRVLVAPGRREVTLGDDLEDLKGRGEPYRPDAAAVYPSIEAMQKTRVSLGPDRTRSSAIRVLKYVLRPTPAPRPRGP
jgi:hypothetical protein